MNRRRLVTAGFVLLLVLAAGVGVWFVTRPRPQPPPTPAGPELIVRVTAEYPGVDAQTVADTVAVPIEQQVNGVEGQTRLESESRDGRYTLTVRFAPNIDLDAAAVLVQNRINAGLRLLPDEVRRRGVRVRKAVAGRPVVWVSVTGRATVRELAEVARQTVVPSLDRLSGVAEVVVVGADDGFAEADGTPVVLVGVTPWPGGATAADVRATLASLQGVPDWVSVAVGADVVADGVLVVAVQLQDSASVERTREAVALAVELVGKLSKVAGTLAYSEPGRANAAVLLVKRAAGPTPAEVQQALDQGLPDALWQVSEATAGREPFPLRVAVCDTGGQGYAALEQAAGAVADRWRADPAVTGVGSFLRQTVPRVRVVFDHDKLQALGVSAGEVAKALGADGVTDFGRDRPGWTARLADPRAGREWKRLQVRSASGELVPLSAVASVHETEGPEAVVRVDLYPAMIVSAYGPRPPAVDPPSGFAVIDLSR